MTTPTTANYVFLPWARQGAASGIQTTDTLGANQSGSVLVSVKLQVNTSNLPERQVRLYGPGDIIGLDQQQVIRTEPRHLTMDFEPNYFPAIEFDRPDFPWLFTPAKADTTGRLRPWLCLIVLEKQEGVELRTVQNVVPLPILEIKAPAQPGRELPDLSESWAWAHSQVMGSQRDHKSLQTALAGESALNLSRLLCPRRLDPQTDYLACLVPTFELGRKAGLGLPIDPADEQKLDPAWTSGVQSPVQVTLPVYFHWEFHTGVVDDFEELVRKLTPLKSEEISEKLGKRLIDISQPGFQIAHPLPPNTILELEGALRVAGATIAEWSQATRMQFQTNLREILNAPAQAMKKEKSEPLLAPPIYGSWQAAQQTVEVTPQPHWLDDLNLDPRHRAVAALGTQVVQDEQEQLMAAAWEQLGEIQPTNQMLRQAQLGRAVNLVYYHKHFAAFPDETFLKVVASGQSRIVLAAADHNPRAFLSHRISQSALPARAISAPMRRLTSPRSAISVRFSKTNAPPIAIVITLNNGIPIVSPLRKEAGLATIDHISKQVEFQGADPTTKKNLATFLSFDRISDALTDAPPLNRFEISAEGDWATLLKTFDQDPIPLPHPIEKDSPDARAFREAAKAHQEYLLEKAFPPTENVLTPLLDLSETNVSLLQSINPEKTIPARVQAALKLATGTPQTTDPLEPILDAPDFPQPMYEALRDLSQDFLLPGLEHILPNRVTVLETNPKFIESFLVGLNHEMSRELLWRGYPTDQRGTYFRQFWDMLDDNDRRDIEMIKEWGKKKLGENVHTGEQLVLLIRSDLLRRYPNSVIYAVKAVSGNPGEPLKLSTDVNDENHPVFRGTLKPDVTFLGFDLPLGEVTANPGYFFVIQQQPTEPRFGLDEAEFDKPLPELKTTWNNLSWRHLANTEEELKALSYISVEKVKNILPVTVIDKVEWGRNAAHLAYITLQRPVRIAIHASQMI